MEKATEVFDKLTSNIVEYIRYALVAGISLMATNICSTSLYEKIIKQDRIVLILGLAGFGVLVYFVNRTLFYPRLEVLADIGNPDTFRNFVRRIRRGLRFYQINDLWITYQDGGHVGENLSKYKIWRASMEMTSGLSLVFGLMSTYAFSKGQADPGKAYFVLFATALFTTIQSSRNFERRFFNILKTRSSNNLRSKIENDLNRVSIETYSPFQIVSAEAAKLLVAFVLIYQVMKHLPSLQWN